METLIKLALALLGIQVTARRSKHKALGRARRAWFYAGRHFVSAAGGVGDIMPASVLIDTLRRERALATA